MDRGGKDARVPLGRLPTLTVRADCIWHQLVTRPFLTTYQTTPTQPEGPNLTRSSGWWGYGYHVISQRSPTPPHWKWQAN
eukprot:9028787-Pyramimonas_sp.AAC.1